MVLTRIRARLARTHVSTGAALATILVICAVTRVGWAVHISADSSAIRTADSKEYIASARALDETGAFDTTTRSGEPMFFRTPGYPAFLAAIFTVGGDQRTASIVQALLSCLAVPLAFLIARRLWDSAVGLLAAAIVAVDPLQFAYSGTLLTESLFSVALLVAILIGTRLFDARNGPSWTLAAGLGLAIAIATLIRPTTYFLPIFIGIALSWIAIKRRTRAAVLVIVAFALPVVLVFGAWQTRNHVQVDSWRMSGGDSVIVFSYRAAGTLAERDGRSLASARDSMFTDLLGRRAKSCIVDGIQSCAPRQPRGQGPFYDDLFNHGVEIMRSNPWPAAIMTARGLGHLVFEAGTDTVATYLGISASSLLKNGLRLWLAVLYIATGIGIVLALRRDPTRRPAQLFVLGTGAYVILTSAGTESYSRYRLPVMPIIAMYAAFGALACIRRFRPRSDPKSASAPA